MQKIAAQAISILFQLNAASASQFYEVPDRIPSELIMLDGAGRYLRFDDLRSLEDDLAALCELGLLLRQGSTEVGTRAYTITRAGSQSVRVNSGDSSRTKDRLNRPIEAAELLIIALAVTCANYLFARFCGARWLMLSVPVTVVAAGWRGLNPCLLSTVTCMFDS